MDSFNFSHVFMSMVRFSVQNVGVYFFVCWLFVDKRKPNTDISQVQQQNSLSPVPIMPKQSSPNQYLLGCLVLDIYQTKVVSASELPKTAYTCDQRIGVAQP